MKARALPVEGGADWGRGRSEGRAGMGTRWPWSPAAPPPDASQDKLGLLLLLPRPLSSPTWPPRRTPLHTPFTLRSDGPTDRRAAQAR